VIVRGLMSGNIFVGISLGFDKNVSSPFIYRHQKIINYTNRKERCRLFALTVDEGVQARRLLGNRSFVTTHVMTQTKFKRAAAISPRTVSSSVAQGLLPVRVLVTIMISEREGS